MRSLRCVRELGGHEASGEPFAATGLGMADLRATLEARGDVA